MDPLTHGLASFAATRAFFPRASRLTFLAAIAAGTLADLDGQSAHLGPAVFLAAHRTYTHSVVGSILIALFVAVACAAIGRRRKQAGPPPVLVFGAASAAAATHLAMDVCQSEGVQLFWPFSDHRFATDWLAHLDPWILVILLAGALLPALLQLVTQEIGARAKGPRGRAGAVLALSAVLAYTGGRAILHANAVAALEERTYRGKNPRRAAAFPETASPFQWRGIVETESALHEAGVPLGPGAFFDPEGAVAIFKPEPSAALEAARGAEAARRFLRFGRFPKATIEKTAEGYRVELRDLRYAVVGETDHALAALIELGPDAKVLEQEIVWERDLPR